MEPPAYLVTLRHRGGQAIVQLPWTQIAWGRALDNTSAASVHVPITSPTHPKARLLKQRMAWIYELGVWRDGEEVWVGPVLEPEWSGDGVSINARDLTQWFERRVEPLNRGFNNQDLATIFRVYSEDAMVRDPIPGIALDPSPTGVRGHRRVDAAEHRICGDLMRELARDGLDYTTVAREIITGGAEVPAESLLKVTNYWLKNPKIREAGLLRGTEIFVMGSSAGGDTDPVVGVFGGTHSVDPPVLVQRVFNEPQVTDVDSATAAAATRWDEIHESPEYISGEWDPDRGPAMEMLIPGARAGCDLTVGCRNVLSTVRLSSLDAQVAAGEDGVTETVALEFIPEGTIDQGGD